MFPTALIFGGGLVLLTAYAVRSDESEMGLWALVAASLLASPVARHNYLVLLGPGILLLLARGRRCPYCFWPCNLSHRSGLDFGQTTVLLQ